MSLKDLFENHRHLFNNYQGEYSLLAKIITTSDNLSVQVHPNDDVAICKHNQLGKPESWYVLDCNKDSSLVYGHNAKTKKELEEMVINNQWDMLLKTVDIKKSDFLYVPTGKVHGITSNVVIYELQRSSDVTYRFYDFNRIDSSTNQYRELHTIDSINCTTVPDSKKVIINNFKNKAFTSKEFSLYVLECDGYKEFETNESCDWLQLTVIDGCGWINGVSFEKSESAITINQVEKLIIKGKITVIISWIKRRTNK